MAQATYTGTMFYPTQEKLAQAKVIIYVYDSCKYDGDAERIAEVEYTGLESWTIVEGDKEAEEIEAHTDCEDEYHEYLILNFANGETSTFRNSHVTMFIR